MRDDEELDGEKSKSACRLTPTGKVASQLTMKSNSFRHTSRSKCGTVQSQSKESFTKHLKIESTNVIDKDVEMSTKDDPAESLIAPGRNQKHMNQQTRSVNTYINITTQAPSKHKFMN